MKKRYLLVIRYEYSTDALLFYTLEEAKITAENYSVISKSTIIDLENENIKGQGCE